MIDIADGNMCAAVSPDGDEIVIVAQNFGNDRTTTVDLSDLNGPATAEVYQTSDAKSCEKVETQDVTDGVLDITLPKKFCDNLCDSGRRRKCTVQYGKLCKYRGGRCCKTGRRLDI